MSFFGEIVVVKDGFIVVIKIRSKLSKMKYLLIFRRCKLIYSNQGLESHFGLKVVPRVFVLFRTKAFFMSRKI